jgi:CubicO group peptidase (beta-lactamase class C family)
VSSARASGGGRGIIATAKLLSILIALAIAVAGCSHAEESTAAKPRNIEELKTALAALLAEYRIPGVGVALVTTDKVIWAGGVGKADLATGREVNADTMFRLGSITKSFVGLAALQLHERGKLDLDAKVRDLAPEVPIENRWSANDPITVAQVLENTAGFDDAEIAEIYDFDAPPEKPLLWTLQHFPEPQRARWRPGQRTAYSNAGYGVAGYLIEKAAGMPAEQFIAENIARPLGMAHSDLRLTPEVKSALAQGYDHGAEPVPYYPFYLRTAVEMKSSAAEMARFVRMMLGRGALDGTRIASAESIARMETPETSLAARAGLKYGYGLGNFADLSEAIVTRGHTGGIDGFLSRYAYIPERGVGYFFAINSLNGHGYRAIEQLLFDYSTRDLPKPKEPAIALGAGASQLAGYYEFADPRREQFKFIGLLTFGVNVEQRGGALYIKPIFGARTRLVPVGPNLFRTESQPAASTVFAVDGAGNQVMISAFSPLRPQTSFYVRTDPVWPMTRLALIIAAIVVMFSSIVAAPIWIAGRLQGRMRTATYRLLWVVPLLAVVAFAASYYPAFVYAKPLDLTRPDWVTLALFIGSYLFAILSLAGLVLAIRSLRLPISLAVRIHSLLVSCACAGLAWYLAYWGFIGLRIWAS